jgi:hypothetical protein
MRTPTLCFPTLCALLFAAAFPPLSAAELTLQDAGVQLQFDHTGARLRLLQIRRADGTPLLYADQAVREPGAGPVGNPLAVVVRDGRYQGVYGMERFHVKSLTNSPRRLLVYLAHDEMPLELALEIEVEGNVVRWRGQAFWNGDTGIDLDIYYPLLSRVRFDAPERDRILVAKTSGLTLGPLSELNYGETYIGSLAAPVMLAEGGNRGLAFVDDNRTDWGPDPSAAAQHGQVAGNTFPLPGEQRGRSKVKGGEQGPYAGIRTTRWFRPIQQAGGEAAYDAAEKPAGGFPIKKLGDAVDLGPVLTYPYEGTWKQGAAWARTVRDDLRFRVSPAEWFRQTTFIAEAMGDDLVRTGKSAYDYPKVLAEKQKMGADLFLLPGFHDPEVLGTSYNFLNRGDYFLTAQNLGGPEAVRQGVATIHRQGGHVLYYIEGLIVWKRSRIGRGGAAEWALMNADGSYFESYKGFYHMCPADPRWQEWFAKMAAEVMRTTGVDGFFIDSLTATSNHRCFNPAHHHPHPDVWNWGVRQTLQRMREELDKVNPNAVLFTEGEADIAREFVDGFVSHSHSWGHGEFTEPLVRFLHSDMRAYESWGNGDQPEREFVFNAVHGHRIYAHNWQVERMAPLSLRTRRYYDAYPELSENPISLLDAKCTGCLTELFEGRRMVVSAGNPTGEEVEATLSVPAKGAVLFDRVDGLRLPLERGTAKLKLRPWEFRCFELRP